MSKQSGLGDGFLIGGYDLSGDVNALGTISSPWATLDVTAINKSAHERLYGLQDGQMDFTTIFNPAAGAEHPVLSTLPRTDVVASYLRGTSLGSPAASLVAKQIDYAPNRANDGLLTNAVSLQANAFGIDWGTQLTPGVYTATNLLTGQNTGFEGGIGTWVVNQNSTVAASSAQAHTGTGSLAITSTGTSNASAVHASPGTAGFAVTPGMDYLTQGWFRAATSARSVLVAVNWFASAGTFISTSAGSTVTDSTSGWTLAQGRFTAPATAAWATVIAQVNAPGAGGEVHYVDDVWFEQMGTAVDFGADALGNFNAQGYLQITGLTGTDVTVRIQTSHDNGVTDPFADRIVFSQATSAPFTQRQQQSSPATQLMKRYARVVVNTAGGYSALSYMVALTVNNVAVTF